MEESRERMLEIFNRSQISDQPLSWFEDLYSESDENRGLIPWDWQEPHPFLIDWVEQNDEMGNALVVGCGLGEDASFLNKRGWDVTAFDISESAVSWARKLHPQRNLNWVVEDLLDPPTSWRGKFDLVLEVHILQAIPEQIRKEAAPILSSFLSEGGALVCIGRLGSEEDQEGPPWPLTAEFIEEIGKGLERVEFYSAEIPEKESTRYRAVWRNSAKSKLDKPSRE
tara:strand:- start:8702 stop:9379 length:678 start_codon:yes stop_codon:yes gene_type:complete